MTHTTFSNNTVQQTPAVSIIIPVYNAQNSLNRCIDSILRQSYTNFELILVDDGSQDSSGSICDDYAAMDNRIRVIHKSNSGVSDSRNTAIDHARSTYIQFVDADDWIAPEATGLLVTAATTHSCDMVISDFYRVIDNRIAHKGDIQDEGLLNRKEFASYMMEKPADFYYGVLWNKLYKKDLIEQHHLRMNSKISWAEDFMFNLEYISHTENIYVLRVPLYYYVRTKHSLSSQGANIAKTIQMKLTVFEYYNKFYKEVFDENDYEKRRLQVYRFMIDAASDGVVPPSLLPGSLKLGEERVHIDPTLFENLGVLSDIYLKKKSLEAAFQLTLFRYDLQLNEAWLLLYLNHNNKPCTRKELADFIGCSKRSLSIILQTLKTRGLITWTEHVTTKAVKTKDKKPNFKMLDIHILPAALPILESLKNAQNTYYESIFNGFSAEEIELYRSMSKRIEENMLKNII